MAFNYDNGGARASRLGYRQTKPAGPLKYSPVASALSGYTPLSGGGATAPRVYGATQVPDAGGSNVQAPAAPRPPHQPVSERPLPTPIVPYDINTDPILQQITSYLGRSDEDAAAAALKQRKDLLLGYGDANLSRSLLHDEDQAAAAGSNPVSTLAGLRTQRDRNTHSLTDALNKDNLFYGGARITQEKQAADDYVSALAQAAAAIQGGLGTIDSNLAGALGANQMTRISGMSSAYDRHKDEHTGGNVDPPIVANPITEVNPLPETAQVPVPNDAGYTPMPQLVVAAGNEGQTPRRPSDPTGRTKTNPTFSLADLFRLLGG